VVVGWCGVECDCKWGVVLSAVFGGMVGVLSVVVVGVILSVGGLGIGRL